MAFDQRFVTVSGGGLHDGSSEANAWTWAEFGANHNSGDYINIKAGNYGTVAGVTMVAGTALTYTILAGYNTTPGDLDEQGRNSDGTINNTNFPVVDLSSLIVPAEFVIFRNIRFTGSPSSGLIYTTSIDNFAVINCDMNYSGTGYALRGDNGVQVYDSDLYCPNTPTVIDADRFIQVIGCRIKGGTGTGNIINAEDGVIEDNLIIGSSTSIGVQLTANAIVSWMIKNNTIYGIGTGIQLPNTLQVAMRTIRNNHITDCAKEIDILYSTTANTGMIEISSRTRDNTTPRTGVGDGVNVGEVTTDTGGPETDFEDYTNEDFNLISSAPGIDSGRGMGAWDIGAYQNEEGGAGGSSAVILNSVNANRIGIQEV